jgi:hypothetical protein
MQRQAAWPDWGPCNTQTGPVAPNTTDKYCQFLETNKHYE